MKNIRYYGFWLLDALKGGKIKKNLDEIKYLMEKEDISDWQDKKIALLLKTAVANCEFYRDYSKYTELSECPVINKAVIKDNYNEMISAAYDRTTLHKMSTSGSTGTPFEILQNPEKRNRVVAELIYFNSIIGQNLGDKFIFYRVWTDKNKKSRIEQIKQNLVPIDILRLDDSNLGNIVDILLKDKKIKSTLAYASTYDMIYNYMKKNGIKGDFEVKAMVSSSELLTDVTRDGLEGIIGCRVVNRYSNQENGVIAQSDLVHRELVINKAGYYVEILKLDCDKPAQPGETGRIVITDLFNYAMPLIRYDTGDMGIIADGENGVYGFESISGRRVDMIYDTQGRALTPHTWSVYMWKYDKLKQYQFIQDDANDYTLKVNGAEGVYTEDELKNTLKSVLGDDANIKIEFVKEIPVLASGKFKKTICNYNPAKKGI